jgi:ABC-type antimicrobial peptide transport system permease subunit
MILKNLFRRMGRTLLTVLGISIGVMSIILLGAMADGFSEGYSSVIAGADADLVLSQPDTLDISLAGIDEEYGDQLAQMSEVSEVAGMVQGIVTADELPYFYIFGYPINSFAIERFQIDSGVALNSHDAQNTAGTPILLGSASAEALNKKVGDSIKITSTTYRIVGIYTTGSPFEDAGAVVDLSEAQRLLGRQRQVSMFYIQLDDPALADRVRSRATRLFPDMQMTTSSELVDQQIIGDVMGIYVIAIGGMAVVIGGVVMANSQLMSVYERTREIGTLRAIGWGEKRVLTMILGESVVTSLLGGVVGIGLGYIVLWALRPILNVFGASISSVSLSLILEAGIVVVLLGIVGGIYPAWRGAKLTPIEALRYEGGSAGQKSKRFPFGGMAIQSLWQRTTRTLLTLGVIALVISSIIALQSIVDAVADLMGGIGGAGSVEIMVRQADVADTSQSVIDESVLQRLRAWPEIQDASGLVFTAVAMPEAGGFFVIQGYDPHSYTIQHFNIVEGEPLRGNRQIIIGRTVAEALNKDVGDTLEISGSRFKIVGIFETGTGWEELGGVVTTRDAQVMTGKPRKVTLAHIKLFDPNQAEAIVAEINELYPDVYASLASDFAEQLPDLKATDAMLSAIALIAILIGGVGIMNTMLMAIMERTREIGTLRALGWRRRRIMGMIMQESIVLALLGGFAGLILAILIVVGFSIIPVAGEALRLSLTLEGIANAFGVSLTLGVLGGLYPAWRATQMQPIEALRYE